MEITTLLGLIVTLLYSHLALAIPISGDNAIGKKDQGKSALQSDWFPQYYELWQQINSNRIYYGNSTVCISS